jgi:hypothetical protein
MTAVIFCYDSGKVDFCMSPNKNMNRRISKICSGISIRHSNSLPGKKPRDWAAQHLTRIHIWCAILDRRQPHANTRMIVIAFIPFHREGLGHGPMKGGQFFYNSVFASPARAIGTKKEWLFEPLLL